MATQEMDRRTKAPDLGEAAIVMAIGIVVERVSRLSDADKADLYELVKELGRAHTEEDLEAVRIAMREILEQESSAVLPLPSAADQPAKMKKWTEFVSAKIRELRKQRGWTQEDLSKKSGLPQSHISRLEMGQHSPSNETVRKLAAAFGVAESALDPSAD